MNANSHVLIVGFGDLGAEVARQLLEKHMQVTGVKRHPELSNSLFMSTIRMIAADVTQPEGLAALEHLKPDVLLYCVAANAQTDAAYQSAYVDGLRHVLATQKNNEKLKHVFFISSTRVYGQETDALIDETTEPIPSDFGGQRLLQGEQLLNSLTCGSTVLRLSGIYGPGRLRMITLSQSGRWPEQNAWSNRIHRDDAARFVVFLIQQVLNSKAVDPCFIVTDSSAVTQYEVLGYLAEKLKQPEHNYLPPTGGKRLSNQRLLETGFELQYPDYRSGYAALVAEQLK